MGRSTDPFQESYFTYDTDEHSSVDHDICFRPGINAKGEETYTPRTLVYDLKGGFGGLRKWGGLYDQQMNLDERPEEDEEDGIWYVGHGADGRRLLSFADHGHGRRDGNVSTLTAPTIPQHGYQTSLEQDDPQPELLRADPVRYWSDFNHVFYHPRSIVPLNDYELNSSILPFEKFETGDDLFRGIGKDDDNIMDRDVRPWAEESDHMQGIQIFANDDNAWAGFASRYIEALRDEYGKLPIWLVGVGESGADDTRTKRALKALNASKLICDTSDSLFVPVIVPSVLPPYVQMDRQSLWQRSALLATAVESATLPSRLRDNGGRTGHLGDLGAFLNFEGKRNIAQLQFSAMNPAVALTNDSLAHEDMDLFGFEGPEGSADHTFGVVKCIRGRSHELTNGEVERSPSPKRQMLDSTLVERFVSRKSAIDAGRQISPLADES